MKFPAPFLGASLQSATWNALDPSEEPSWIIQGQSHLFSPAGLPPPDWFLAVNTNPCDDAFSPNSPEALNQVFAPGTSEACLMMIEGATLEGVQKMCHAHAQKDIHDIVGLCNSALYAVWDVGQNQLAVLGLDNSSTVCSAVTAVSTFSDKLGGQLAGGFMLERFSPEELLSATPDPGYSSDITVHAHATLSRFLTQLQAHRIAAHVAPNTAPRSSAKM